MRWWRCSARSANGSIDYIDPDWSSITEARVTASPDLSQVTVVSLRTTTQDYFPTVGELLRCRE